VKSIAGFICFVSLFCSAAYGETRLFDKPYDLSLAVQAGLLYGTSYEIVYQDEKSNEYLSELRWELKPLFVMGLNFSLEPVRTWGLFTRFSIKAGFPAVSGTMEDRDWLDLNNSETLTNFSKHSNKTQAAVFLTLDTGFSFLVTDWFYLRPFVSFDYIFFKMEGRNGYYRYANANNDWETGTFSGAVIRYSQHWFLLSPGVSFGFMVNRFTIKGAIKITPLVFCVGIDDHLLSEALFTDYMFGKIAVEPSLDVSFAISPRFDFGYIVSYWYITGTRGDTVRDNYGSNSSDSGNINSAGAGLKLFEGALYLRVFLGKR